MIRDMFPLLPTFCRLVCTCRSEGEVPHIVHSLRAKLTPLEVRGEEAWKGCCNGACMAGVSRWG